MANPPKKLLLIDANSLIHRAFHALPPLTSADGTPAGALYGLANTLLKILRDENPHYVAAAFDTPETTFRKEIFEKYKAHRPKMPDELRVQIEESHNLFKAFGILTLEKAGVEADDIIGTLVKRFKNKENLKIIILTGDLDTLQLVFNNNVVVLTPKRGISEMKKYNEEAVKERYGVEPKMLPDFKGLVGDPSDNIPGVPGIGQKGAAELLREGKRLEDLCKKAKKEKTNKLFQKLAAHQEVALLSKNLATIKTDVPLKIELKDLKYDNKEEELIKYFDKLGFRSLVERITSSSLPSYRKKDHSKENVVVIESAMFLIKHPQVARSNAIKVAYEWKPIIKKLNKKNIDILPPLFDVKIAAWLTDPDKKNLTLSSISRRFAKKEEADLKTLFFLIDKKINAYGLKKIFEEIEMPLVSVLAQMEEWGIGINLKLLKKTKKEIDKELSKLSQEIYKIAGFSFNLNSPKQVSEALFQKLKIRGKKNKTASGHHKTSEAALSEIKEDHPIIGLVLKYRQLFKIKSSYLLPLIKEGGERIHTTFLQTATATGRLASESPNLQNIPKGSRWGDLLRKSFVPANGFSFVSFDYSQLELRLLAHVSGDPNLIRVFKENKDVHQETASKVFGLPSKKVGSKERSIAKTLNFGVIYGMGPRAFSKQSGLSFEKSKEFIKKYFTDFPKIREWQEKVKKEAQTKGFVTNLNGRRRWIAAGEAMERAAINMPIQSLGADIIKTAMIKIFAFLKEKGILGKKVRLLLSIHDELLLEISNDILKDIMPQIKKILEEEVYKLSVPLIVNVSAGKNWGEMKKYE